MASGLVDDHGDQLFVPADAARTWQFRDRVNAKHGLTLRSYEDLYDWSTSHLADFWGDVWDETAIVGHKGAHVVDEAALPSANPNWFKDARVNWAENMLRCRAADKDALVELTEPTAAHPTPPLRRLTYAGLYAVTADLVSALLAAGVKSGDRVASYASNCIENVAACLAATALGCIWVSAAADFGPDGVLERFEQVRPVLLFAVDGVAYNGRAHAHLPKLRALLAGLAAKDVAQPKVVVVPFAGKDPAAPPEAWDDGWVAWTDFVAQGKTAALGRTPDGEIEWARMDFNWPLWILFSSGTTGRPKPIVHRAGGMLIQALKEHLICADIKPNDVFFYYTTTGWMMFNYLVSALATGCTLVLYDGSPLRDPAFLWKAVDDLGITLFGTSAKYLDQLAKGYEPAKHHSLTRLRQIYSTGSPLAATQYDYVYSSIKRDVLLASITGGTDICSLFAGVNSALPVYRGELQCRMLGMAVNAVLDSGAAAPRGVPGELVCTRPAPCFPAGFWPLPGFGSDEAVRDAQERYHAAYFVQVPGGVWYHGDHVMLTPSRAGNAGGLVMLGRSDGVLNPGGVRFGSAELYDVLEAAFGAPAGPLADCLAVGQLLPGGADERVVLAVRLAGGATLGKELEDAMRAEVRKRRSARHVPARIVQVQDVPYTLNGKRVEVPVKKIINGAPISSVNPATLRNAECLEEYVALGERLRSEIGM